MDGQLSGSRAAEKEKIRGMLRDAVRILCQNTVSHHRNLTVEALFGITIDDGEDSIIFSIHESIDVAEDEASEIEEQYENQTADASYPSYELQETAVNNSQFNNSFAYGQQDKPAVPYQAVVKKETVISYNVGQYDTIPHNSVTSNQTASQYFAADGSYSGYTNTDYGHQPAFGVGDGQKIVASGPQRGRGRGTGRVLKRAPRQNAASARSFPTVKQEHGSEVDTAVGGKKRSLDADEVSHVMSDVTLYTCQSCGKQFKLLHSFQRHKKLHLGMVFRCEGCLKIYSRSDHLLVHQRKCPAALSRLHLTDN